MGVDMNTTRLRYSRTAGVLYLTTHATSVGAAALYAAALDAVASSPLWIRVGVLLEFALALGCLGTGLLLLPVLRHYGQVRAYAFAFLRGLEASVILAGTLPMLVVAWTWTGGSGEANSVLVHLHTASFLIGQGLVIAVNTLLLGSLLLTSRLVPRALACLGLAGGAIVLVSDTAQLLGLIPMNGPVAAACAIPIFAFEIWFAITLLIGKRSGASRPAAPSVVDGRPLAVDLGRP